MDDHEQRQNALATLAKFRALSTLETDPEAEEIAKELEEQRRSKARNKLIGAGKVRDPKFSEISSVDLSPHEKNVIDNDKLVANSNLFIL